LERCLNTSEIREKNIRWEFETQLAGKEKKIGELKEELKARIKNREEIIERAIKNREADVVNYNLLYKSHERFEKKLAEKEKEIGELKKDWERKIIQWRARLDSICSQLINTKSIFKSKRIANIREQVMKLDFEVWESYCAISSNPLAGKK